MNWGAVVAAGGLERDPLLSELGTPRKALAVFGGKSSLAYTLDAVAAAGLSNCATVSGEDVLAEVVHGILALEGRGAVENAIIGIDALPDCGAVLFLPCDSPRITGPAIARFIDGVEARLAEGAPERWFAAGLCPAARFREAYPTIDSEALHLREGPMVSGALYAASPAGVRHAVDLLSAFRDSRKSQFGMAWRFGIGTVVRYLLHRIDVSEAERKLERVLGGRSMVLTDSDPCACLDFDTVSDYRALQAMFRP